MMDLGDIQFSLSVQTGALIEGLNEAQAALEEFARAQQSGGDGAEAAANKMNAAMLKMGAAAKQSGDETAAAMDKSTMAMAALAAAALKGFNIVVGAIQSGIVASNQYRASMQGLQSVAEAKGIGSGELQSELDALTDQFFTTANASTALKNLLSRGYSMEQAVSTITRLKDAAAFGRQASYDLGTAVVTATEGLKNENSILVDNAGVTKNVSVMWKEYAESIGVGVQSLTQAQKIEAEYAGIARETAAQTGDLAKLSQTLAGAQAETSAKTTKLAEAFGESMTPSVEAGTNALNTLLSGLTSIVQQTPTLTAGVTTATTAFLGLSACITVVSTLKKAMEALSLTTKTFGTLAAIALAFGAIISVVDAVKRANEAKAASEAALVAEHKSKVEQLSSQNAELEKLAARYEALSQMTDRTYSESMEMSSIESTLASKYGVTAGAVDALAGKYETLTKRIRDKTKAMKEDLIAANSTRISDLKDDVADAQQALEDKTSTQHIRQSTLDSIAFYERLKKEAQATIDAGASGAFAEAAQSDIKSFSESITTLNSELAEMNAELQPYKDNIAALASQLDQLQFENTVLKFEIDSGSVSQTSQDIAYAFKTAIDTAAPEIKGSYDDLIKDVMTNSDLENSVTAADSLLDTLIGGGALSKSQKSELNTLLMNIWDTLADMLPDLGEGVEGSSVMNQIMENIFGTSFDMSSFEGLDNWIAKMQQAAQAAAASNISQNTETLSTATTEYENAAKAVEDYKTTLDEQNAALGDLTKGTQEYTDAQATIAATEASLSDAQQTASEKQQTLSESLALMMALYPELIAQKENATGAELTFINALTKANSALIAQGRTAKTTASSTKSATKEFNKASASQAEWQAYIDEGTKALEEQSTLLTQQSSLLSDVQAMKTRITETGALTDADKQLAQSLGLIGSTTEETAANIDAFASRLADTLISGMSDADSMSQNLQDDLGYLAASRTDITVNTSGAVSAMNSAKATALALIAILKAAGLYTGGGGGGGGGNSKYQKDITALEHLKKLEQVDNEQELERLLELQQKYTN
ncbi:MAG: hypothetical protein PHX51_08045, partial [Clostridia bacterium]|nr:hypothetical protein [Clostridia bacterium]